MHHYVSLMLLTSHGKGKTFHHGLSVVVLSQIDCLCIRAGKSIVAFLWEFVSLGEHGSANDPSVKVRFWRALEMMLCGDAATS